MEKIYINSLCVGGTAALGIYTLPIPTQHPLTLPFFISSCNSPSPLSSPSSNSLNTLGKRDQKGRREEYQREQGRSEEGSREGAGVMRSGDECKESQRENNGGYKTEIKEK